MRMASVVPFNADNIFSRSTPAAFEDRKAIVVSCLRFLFVICAERKHKMFCMYYSTMSICHLGRENFWSVITVFISRSSNASNFL